MYKLTLRLFMLVALFSAAGTMPLSAQNEKDEKAVPPLYIGISPVILDKDDLEISLTNSLVSFWLASKRYVPEYGDFRINNRHRFSRFDQSLRVSYGFDKNTRWDLGAELRFAHLRLDDEARSSPFRVLGKDTPSGESHGGVSYVGMRLRFMPFGELPELTFQANFHYPMARDSVKRQHLDAQRTQAGMLATYYQPFNDRILYFLQADWQTHFKNDEKRANTHSVSIGGYLVFSLFNGEKWRLFPGINYGTGLQAASKGLRKVNHQLLGGLGLQHQPGQRFSIYFNAQIPFILDSGSEYVDWVEPSFSAISLGLRSMF